MAVNMKNIIPLCMLVIVSMVSYGGEYKVPKKPASIAVADIDHDGDLDIIIGHEVSGIGGLVSVLINNGKGEFFLKDTSSTGAYETSIQSSYINDNKEPDIIMLDYHKESKSTAFSIVYDYGSRSFDSVKQFPLYQQLTISDYSVTDLNKDNFDDIIFISPLSKVMGILYNNGKGELSPPQYFDLGFNPSGLAVGDLNNDGRDDIAICGSKIIRVFLNSPSGFDTLNISNLPTYLSDVKIADLNNDGKNEIIGCEWGMAGTRKRILIFALDENKNYKLSYSKWIDEAMANISIADLNNDNYNDIIYNVSYSYPNSDYELFHTYILFNNKDGTFQDPVNYYTGICSHKSYVADLNGDGWNDIVTLNYDFYTPPPDTGTIHILFNDGTGKFKEEPITSVKREKPIPQKCELYQNYPNPFNPNTHLQFSIGEPLFVLLKIYDVLGKEVAVLVNENKDAGTYTVEWNAAKFSSGIYFVRFQAGNASSMRKIALVR